MADDVKKDEKKEKKEILGLTITHLSTALLSLLLGAIVPSILLWINTRSPVLTYLVSDVISFDGDKHKTGILNITVYNDGSKRAENVSIQITTGDATIQEVKIKPEILKGKHEQTKADLHITIPTLNATESVQIATLISSVDKLKQPLSIIVRGDDIVGTPKIADSQYVFLEKSNLWKGAAFGFFIVTVIFFVGYINRRKRDLEEDVILSEHEARIALIDDPELMKPLPKD